MKGCLPRLLRIHRWSGRGIVISGSVMFSRMTASVRFSALRKLTQVLVIVGLHIADCTVGVKVVLVGRRK